MQTQELRQFWFLNPLRQISIRTLYPTDAQIVYSVLDDHEVYLTETLSDDDLIASIAYYAEELSEKAIKDALVELDKQGLIDYDGREIRWRE